MPGETADYSPSGSGVGQTYDAARETAAKQAQAGRIAPPVTTASSQPSYSPPPVAIPPRKPKSQTPVPTVDSSQAANIEEDVLPSQIVSSSEKVLRLVFDLTLSMRKYVEEVWSHMGSLDLGVTPYLGKDRDIGLFGFADAIQSDPYPLQARDFVKSGMDLARAVLALKVDQFGGKNWNENAELIALYLSRKVVALSAKTDVTIFVTDEFPYDEIESKNARLFTGVRLSRKMTVAEVFDELKQKTQVYLILRPYTYNDGKTVVQVLADRIYSKWVGLLGQDHIAVLDDPKRIVDVICGIIAKETNMTDFYEEEIRNRQTALQVAVASRALQSVHGRNIQSQSKMNFGQNP